MCDDPDDGMNAVYLDEIVTLQARLDVALRGALQSREEMREWLGSDEAVLAAARACGPGDPSFGEQAFIVAILAALIAAMPGGDA